jgi:glutamate-1-semialdehyde 2,1-aminomutase
VIKFEGCYHGHADPFLINAGSGAATLGIQSVPGVTQSTADDTLTAGFNDIDSVKQLVEQNKNKIAAIIIEPVAGNMGCVPPLPGFLQQLRKLCDEESIILIFDEVMTGFRLAPGGAQELYSIKADLITYGKIIGGGLPVGAYGGKKEIMRSIAPLGKVYQAGTLSGNPLAMRAGYTTLSILAQNKSYYEQLDRNTAMLAEGLSAAFANSNIPVCINRVGSMMSVHFSDHAVKNFAIAAACNIDLFKRYFHYCLEHGIYLPPSAFETWFISTAITEKQINYTIQTSAEFASNL